MVGEPRGADDPGRRAGRRPLVHRRRRYARRGRRRRPRPRLLAAAVQRQRRGAGPDADPRRTAAGIVGVLPATFRFAGEPDVVLPLRLDRANPVRAFRLLGVARLEPGVSLARANADVARVLRIWLERLRTARPGGAGPLRSGAAAAHRGRRRRRGADALAADGGDRHRADHGLRQRGAPAAGAGGRAAAGTGDSGGAGRAVDADRASTAGREPGAGSGRRGAGRGAGGSAGCDCWWQRPRRACRGWPKWPSIRGCWHLRWPCRCCRGSSSDSFR